MRPISRISVAVVASLAGVLQSTRVLAYRPFDSTDPAVADRGEFEIELSPVTFHRDDSGNTWIAPQLRLNYGFAQNWEVVLEGQGEHRRGAQSTLVDNALSLKWVVQEGSLQEKPGPSMAVELGALLPGINEQKGLGTSIAGIIGQKWSWGAVHFNVAYSLTHDQRGEVFLGTILEGPDRWKVRPVAEVVYEREFGLKEEVAFLAGLIWQVRDTLGFDVAVRQANVDGRPETEIRAGITFAFLAH